MTLFKNKYRVESTRLRDWDYAARGWYFVTICTARRVCHFGEVINTGVCLSEIGREAERQWLDIPRHYPNVGLDALVVMPNHVHGIVVIEGEHEHSPSLIREQSGLFRTLGCAPPAKGSLSAIVRSYKAGLTRWCRNHGLSGFAWQPRYFDRIIGSNASLKAVRDYIERNPVNWSLDANHPDATTRTWLL